MTFECSPAPEACVIGRFYACGRQQDELIGGRHTLFVRHFRVVAALTILLSSISLCPTRVDAALNCHANVNDRDAWADQKKEAAEGASERGDHGRAMSLFRTLAEEMEHCAPIDIAAETKEGTADGGHDVSAGVKVTHPAG